VTSTSKVNRPGFRRGFGFRRGRRTHRFGSSSSRVRPWAFRSCGKVRPSAAARFRTTA